MTPEQSERPRLGGMLKMTMLPHSYAVRWGPGRKAQVVDAIESGLIRLEEALDRYRMSVEEYHAWRRELRERRAKRVRSALAFGKKRIGRMAPRDTPPDG